jgi:hypothetical protein
MTCYFEWHPGEDVVRRCDDGISNLLDLPKFPFIVFDVLFYLGSSFSFPLVPICEGIVQEFVTGNTEHATREKLLGKGDLEK